MKHISKTIEEVLKKRKIDYFELLKQSKGEIIERLSVYHEELLYQNEELSRANENLKDTTDALQALFLETPIPILVLNTSGVITKLNSTASKLLKIKRLNKQKLTNYIHEDSQDDYYLFLKEIDKDPGKQHSISLDLSFSGHTYNVKLYANKESADKDSNLRCVLIDLTNEKKYQNTIEYLATHDQLTDCYNRHFFESYKQVFKKEQTYQKAIVYIDLNNLKLINDAFGHEIGDNTLKELVTLIRQKVSDKDVVCRVGGDEFVIFLLRRTKTQLRESIKELKENVNSLIISDFEVSSAVGYSLQSYKAQPIEEVIHLAEQNMYQEKIYASKSGKLKIVGSILSALYGKDPVEEHHSNRVSKLMFKFAQAIGYSEADQFRLRSAGMLHDIGKIAINYNLLQANRKLSHEEFEEIKRHPEIGYKILLSSRTEAVIAEAALMHHERIDGNGYPRGIPGNKISEAAKMLNICDSFDAMVSPREYKVRKSFEEAKQELVNCSNTQFDEKLVNTFIQEVYPNIEEVYQTI